VRLSKPGFQARIADFAAHLIFNASLDLDASAG
jgi:hypothetical protein